MTEPGPLIRLLQEAGFRPWAVELADALWLARVGVPALPEVEAPPADPPPPPGPEVRRLRARTPQADLAAETDSEALERGKMLGDTADPSPRPPADASFREDARPGADLVQARPVGDEPPLEASGLPFRSPGAAALPAQLEIGRALRPLRRRPTLRRYVLDETATAEGYAETGIWTPCFGPDRGPWLDLTLVLDESPSMDVWHETVRELRELLLQCGVFQEVRTVHLGNQEANHEGHPALYADAPPLAAQPGTVGRRQVRAGELCDPTGRRLILIVTDGVAPIWGNGRLVPWLHAWGRRGPLAIVQMLPGRLWPRTALGAPRARARNWGAGGPNCRLDRGDPSAAQNSSAPRPIPMFPLEPDRIQPWAQLLAGFSGPRVPAVVLDPVFGISRTSACISAASQGGPAEFTGGELPEDEEEDADPPELQLLRAFWAYAPRAAQLLAAYLSVTPLTLPVMRLVRRVMLPQSRQSDLAEVFTSGLLRRETPYTPPVPADAVRYAFLEGVDELLLNTLTAGEMFQVWDRVFTEVSDYVDERTGSPMNFAAFVLDPSGRSPRILAPELRPFARTTARVLRRLGGQYAALAAEIEGVATRAPSPGTWIYHPLPSGEFSSPSPPETALIGWWGDPLSPVLLLTGPSGLEKSRLLRQFLVGSVKAYVGPDREWRDLHGVPVFYWSFAEQPDPVHFWDALCAWLRRDPDETHVGRADEHLAAGAHGSFRRAMALFSPFTTGSTAAPEVRCLLLVLDGVDHLPEPGPGRTMAGDVHRLLHAVAAGALPGVRAAAAVEQAGPRTPETGVLVTPITPRALPRDVAAAARERLLPVDAFQQEIWDLLAMARIPWSAPQLAAALRASEAKSGPIVREADDDRVREALELLLRLGVVLPCRGGEVRLGKEFRDPAGGLAARKEDRTAEHLLRCTTHRRRASEAARTGGADAVATLLDEEFRLAALVGTRRSEFPSYGRHMLAECARRELLGDSHGVLRLCRIALDGPGRVYGAHPRDWTTRRAQHLRRLGRLSEALDAALSTGPWRRLVIEDPGFRATLLLHQGRLPEARRAKLPADYRNCTAYARFLLGETQAGLAALQTTDPDSIHPAHRNQLADALTRLGDTDRARLLLSQSTRPEGNIRVYRSDVQQIELEIAAGNLAEAAAQLDRLEAWAERRDRQDLLCRIARARAELHLATAAEAGAAGTAASDLGHAGEAARAGLQIARACGYGLLEVDLLCLRARTHLSAADAAAAAEDALAALERASADTSRYAWGEAEARHLCGTALGRRFRAALGRDRIQKDEWLADEAASLFQAAECELVRAGTLRACLEDPRLGETDAERTTLDARVAAGARRRNPVDGAELVWVPPGEFTMGDDDSRWAGEKPPHRVRISRGFWLYRTPVTVAQYRAFCEATRHRMPDAPSWGWKDDHPVVNVRWEDAAAYSAWAGARLPTEAQWEYAARGQESRRYPWGDEDPDPSRAVYYGDGRKEHGTAPVGSKPRGESWCGGLDLAGNVWEWCRDTWDSSFYARSPEIDPVNEKNDSKQSRGLRGGSWGNGPDNLRAAVRFNDGDWFDDFGFRSVVCAPED